MSDKIYHYCSIENFEQILKTKSLRFTELNFLEDRNETSLINGKDTYGKCFVSCWTNSAKEQLGMWEHYTGNKSGVRIGISKDLFNKTPQNKCTLDYLKKVSFENQWGWEPTIPEFFCVTYTHDSFFLKERIEGNLEISRMELLSRIQRWGRIKSAAWEEQSECRFKLTILSSNFRIKNFNEKFLDIPFDASQLENMEITLSPINKIKDNDQVYKILTKYVENISLKKSVLNIWNIE